jgi:S1-C subfamily serine protease
MTALTACLFGWMTFSPVVAPVPQESPPDPLARAAMGLGADRNTLLVTDVYENMPAGKAGIQKGDKLIRVGTLRPNDFDQVVNHVCSYRPGALVEVEVERGGDRKVFKLKLVPRPATFGSPRLSYPTLPPDE